MTPPLFVDTQKPTPAMEVGTVMILHLGYDSLVNFLLAAVLVTPDLTETALMVVVALRVTAPL